MNLFYFDKIIAQQANALLSQLYEEGKLGITSTNILFQYACKFADEAKAATMFQQMEAVTYYLPI